MTVTLWHMRKWQPVVLEMSRPVVVVMAITPPQRYAYVGTRERGDSNQSGGRNGDGSSSGPPVSPLASGR